MKTKILLLLLALSLTASAQRDDFWRDIDLTARTGYNIGGTAPIPMPASIRKLNSYTLQANASLGLTAEKHLSDKWGVQASLYFENKGMREDARVKNYHEAIVRGSERLEGQFTGDVETRVTQWMFTLPIEATFHLNNRLKLYTGPYLSWVVGKDFDGKAHNGYLRVGDPTGGKVELGNDPTTWGSYDFDDNMRNWQWGIDIGADWQTWKRTGLYAALKWGLSGVFQSDFHTIEQTLYPIYATVGLTYKLR